MDDDTMERIERAHPDGDGWTEDGRLRLVRKTGGGVLGHGVTEEVSIDEGRLKARAWRWESTTWWPLDPPLDVVRRLLAMVP